MTITHAAAGGSARIELRALSKTFGSVRAVDDLTFTVEPGRVTGFVGPNGAGKSTTMRMILGLDTPTGGQALIGGRAYRELATPLRTVGALLDAASVHPARTAQAHLGWLASNELPPGRVQAVLDAVGLGSAARRRVGRFSLGMRQRLGVAAALLGDPPVLVLDEPVNGLDPDGVIWIRTLIRRWAEEGRTVFVSSHLISELALCVDHLVVIGAGRLLADASLGDFLDAARTANPAGSAPISLEQAYLASTAGTLQFHSTPAVHSVPAVHIGPSGGTRPDPTRLDGAGS